MVFYRPVEEETVNKCVVVEFIRLLYDLSLTISIVSDLHVNAANELIIPNFE